MNLMADENDKSLDSDYLLKSVGNSDLVSSNKQSKSLSRKCKLIIIIGLSISALAIIIAALIYFFLLKDNSDNNKEDEENDQIEILPPIIINPISEYTHCIIWLHGLYATPEHFENLFKVEVPFAKKNNTKIILMRAPYQIMTFSKENVTSWFDIFSFPINNTESYNFTDATKSRKIVEKIIEQEAKELKGNYKNIFIGGHSQGACVTLYTAYNFKELLGGVLACSGILFPQGEIVGDKNELKVFLAHGDQDDSIPFSFHNETVKRIENFEGVKKYYYKGHGHNIADFEKIDMGSFLNDSMI